MVRLVEYEHERERQRARGAIELWDWEVAST
jgi:hypothetical protein